MTRFRSKHDAMNQRKHLWACLKCGATYTDKTHACHTCHDATQYFPSTQEYRRYQMLRVELQAGSVSDLVLQPSYLVVINGQRITKYVADFKYNRGGITVIEDVKGSSDPKHQDPVFLLKKKLVEAVYGIVITVTT